jgi:alanyl aminopeptidase
MRLVFSLVFAASALLAQTGPKAPELRLPNTLRPERCAVELYLDPNEETFSGAIDIEIKFSSPTRLFWLNGSGLSIKQWSLKTAGKKLGMKPILGQEDFIGFALDEPAPAGSATLHIDYEGQVDSRSSSGVFRNKDGNDWYLYTQFEPIDARRAFPCFDEPSYKVPWQITLHVKKEYMALSNTAAVSESDEDGGRKAVRFAETKPLPSYLVAFAVGPFEAVDAGKAGKKRTPLRIIATRGRAGEAHYAAEVTGPILEALEDYFDIPYPYEKLDCIAVPLFSGAMENAGLITYGQTLILAKPELDSIGRQREYAGTAAHEMAHMWFGDLVTTAWWDDLWLNEAFATWMASRVLERWKPEWHEDFSAAAARLGSMEDDSLLSARKIRQPVESKDDIANAFDEITYQKGAAVIYMFEQWIGPERFRKGVAIYMKRHSYSNAAAGDFLAAVSEAAGRNIAPAFSTFLDQAGVPLVSVSLECDREKAGLKLAQKRYLPLGSQAPSKQAWQIPVCYRYGDGSAEKQGCTLLEKPEAYVPIGPAKSCPAWILLNAQEAGYYHTDNKGGLTEKLLAGGAGKLTPAERIGVIDDAQALFRSGDLSAGGMLGLAARFADDPTRQVVASAVEIMEGIDAHLVPERLRPNYERLIGKIYGERAHRLGWQSKSEEDDETKLLRPVLVDLLANRGEDKTLVDQAKQLTDEWFHNPGVVSPEVTGLLLATAAKHGDRDLYDRFVSALEQATEEGERLWLLEAIGSFRQPEIIEANFRLFLSGALDSRESFELLTDPLNDPRTQTLPYKFVTENYDKIIAAMPRGVDTDLSAELPVSATGFCDDDSRARAEAFFHKRAAKTSGGPRILAQVLETIHQCAASRAAEEEGVAGFLEKY